MLDIQVRKRDGSVEDLSEDKITLSIFQAAEEAGGDDYDLASEIASEIVDQLETNDVDEVESESIQRLIEKYLIETGHAATAKQYILKAADRERIREMDTALMRSFEEITFKSAEDSDTKRENANIDSSTAMGTMLKYGSEGAKNFNLLYMMSKDVADAHRNGDIHIHDLDFYTLTETCISENMYIEIKHNGEEKKTKVLQLPNMFNDLIGVDKICDTTNEDLYIRSYGRYTKVLNIVKHKMGTKRMLRFTTDDGVLEVTNDHKVLVVSYSNDISNITDSEELEQELLEKKAEDIDKDIDRLLIGVPNRDNPDDKVRHMKVSKINTIEEIDYYGYVYDMETENHHFDVNGFIVHNCCQIPLDKLLERGFNTGHGFLRRPNSIKTASALAAIAIQSNQNDMHGGQSIPMFDMYLAPYVALSYAKNIAHVTAIKLDLSKDKFGELKSVLKAYQQEKKLIMNDECKEDIIQILKDFNSKYNIKCSDRRIAKILENAYDDTYDETYQAMEAFVHNLNTMHSRAGRSTEKVEVPVTWETLCSAV